MSYANLSEISAEMLLNRLYPDLMDEWKVRFKGTFYRNYSNDAMSVDAPSREVSLARDGFLKLLPAGLISEEGELREGSFPDNYRKINERVELLREQFLPMDSFVFRQSLHIERQISEVLVEKELFVLKQWFGIEWTELKDSLVQELALMLPYLKDKRGNIYFVRDLLQSLMGLEVRLHKGIWSESDTSRRHLPRLRYEIIRDGMDRETYLQESEKLAPAAAFIREWMLPLEAHCEIGYKSFLPVEGAQTLGYNSLLAQ